MNLSYWEYKTWLSNVDFAIIGSGIVGLNCALHLKNKFPNSKILVLEKGILPQGASSKNAGFACFGSISEIVADLKTHSEEAVFQLVKKRWEGIKLLRKNLGDEKIGYQNYGGHELFLKEAQEQYDQCLSKLAEMNRLLRPIFRKDPFRPHVNSFNFKGIQETYISNSSEAQLDTGKMMSALLIKAQKMGVIILNAITVEAFESHTDTVTVHTNHFEFAAKQLLIATNGFAHTFKIQEVKPARAQVLITKPIRDLQIKGTFHLDEGYYYFRNIDNRILFGGGRNLDFTGEETSEFGETELIQDRLEKMLREIILPTTAFEIERRWSGIMGIGPHKQPILKQLSTNVYCGVRLGGMGIAIGSAVGRDLADMVGTS